METKEYNARRKAILADSSYTTITTRVAALTALDAEAGIVYGSGPLPRPRLADVEPLTSAQLDRIDAAQRATEAEQARLDKAL